MYKRFLEINGEHPWRDVSEDGYEDYPVYYRSNGRVLYFNYSLAKEMRLIPKKHPHKLNVKLENIILQTFSLKILNEHDWINKKKFPDDGLDDRLYMATRYLQGQHENKQGKTSGDGRSIWNGFIKTTSKIYDISSRGTGSTILSPGAQEAKDYIKTGSNEYGYASGLADLDEMLAGAVMSEIFYRQKIPTERCLVVIDYPDKSAIGVRVAPNLIRPAHIFRYLKMDKYTQMKDSFDYFLKRQIANRELKVHKRGKNRFTKACEHLARVYAKLAAIMEEEYIFNWLDWDGDNMLASGGILDYGSIRQFAAKHSKYRYEDVDRFSTSLNEQKYWARNTIQTFAQIVDYIETKNKKNLKQFENDPLLEIFDKSFKEERQGALLKRMGFAKDQSILLREKAQEKIEKFRNALNYFEDAKVSEGQSRVADGIDHPPVFLVRNILRELPQYLSMHYSAGGWSVMPVADFCDIMAASYVEQKDLNLTDLRKLKALEFQDCYRELFKCLLQLSDLEGKTEDEYLLGVLKTVAKRSSIINYEYRSTGDGLTWIINEAISFKDKMRQSQLQDTIERFIGSQILIPGVWDPIREEELTGTSMKAELLKKMHENLELYKERI